MFNLHVHSCGNGANQCHLHVHFHGCTQVKLYIYHFMTLIIMIIGKRKYWRWIHPAIWAVTLGRSQQYCHGIPAGIKLLNLVKYYHQLTPLCRSRRTGFKAILEAAGTTGAIWVTRPTTSTPPRRVTSWRQWRDWWREWQTSPCFNIKTESEIINSK